MNKEEIKSMNVTPETIVFIERMLNFLKENELYQAQFNNITIKLDGIVEDTANGKREIYTLVRKVI